MIIVCPSCQARYKFDETKLGQRPRAKTKCAKCGGSIEIENPLFGSMTLPPEPPQSREESTDKARMLRAADLNLKTSRDVLDEGHLEMASGKRYSLAVLQGAATGQIFQLAKPRTILGRAGADINVEDTEASRQHAALELLGDHAILRDLGSTNGTFVDSARIDQRVLTNQSEFRIGSHVLMFIVTEAE